MWEKLWPWFTFPLPFREGQGEGSFLYRVYTNKLIPVLLICGAAAGNSGNSRFTRSLLRTRHARLRACSGCCWYWILIRSVRIRLPAVVFLAHVDVEPLDANVLLRQPIAERRQMVQ